MNLLRNLPQDDAQAVLRSVRSGTDVASIVNHFKVGDILLEMSVSPEARFRYVFPYRSELPQDVMLDNPYLDSMIYESAALYSAGQCPSHVENQDADKERDSSCSERMKPYLHPFHATQVIDPWLSDVRPSSWTAVCHDDNLMRDLLAGFLRCEYQFSAAFQKDYFLEDMSRQQSEFCSSLLVNIVLAYCCICYSQLERRDEYWNPTTLTYRFFVEAQRLWQLSADVPRITTIQASILFNVFYNLCGLDEVGQSYRIHAVDLAHKICLFDDSPTIVGERTRRGRAYTAWALFNWESLVAFAFMHFPLLTKPPDWDLPDPLKEAQWYGEIWLKYPLSQNLSSTYFGHIFQARCRLRVIMNEFCQAAYSKDSALTLEKAGELHSQLQSWFIGLPKPLQPRTIVLPSHLQLHMYYHHLTLAMYELLLDSGAGQDSLPLQMVTAARKYLQTLVRLYYLRHGYDAMNLYLVIPLMLVGEHCINSIDKQTPEPRLEALRSTLILVAKGLADQRRNHYLANALFRVVRGRMRPREAALLRDAVEEDAVEPPMAQAVRSHWPVSVVKNLGDMDSYILTNLVESYAQLTVELVDAAGGGDD